MQQDYLYDVTFQLNSIFAANAWTSIRTSSQSLVILWIPNKLLLTPYMFGYYRIEKKLVKTKIKLKNKRGDE